MGRGGPAALTGATSFDKRLGLQLSAAAGLISAGALALHVEADVGQLDAGELGGAAASLGVAHPTGFALEMLVLRAANLWPIGSLAFRQNLCVGLLASAAVSCIVYCCLRLVRSAGWSSSAAAVAAASVSAGALLSSRTLLDAALSVEVYASSLLCVALAGALLCERDKPAVRALFPLAGLALGAHITAPLLLAPLVGVALAVRRRRQALLLGAISCGACAVIVCYLPLASLRDTAFDWGDPETFERLVQHLSAARIREAYEGSLFARDALPRMLLFEQLVEQPYWLPLALMGAIGLVRQQLRSALLLGIVLCLDLAYAVWINPMGVAQRQVGHASVAVIALLAGAGCALLLERLPLQLRAAGRLAAVLISAACLWVVARALLQTPASDGYLVSERYGSGSPLSELPPRAVFVCESDSACAGALFAVYAEGIRPDLDVVPAQHLWDPSVLRRLRYLPLSAVSWPAPSDRARSAERRLQTLLAPPQLRPMYLERLERLPPALQASPVLRLVPDPSALASLERARFGTQGPTSERSRELWASAHEAAAAQSLARGELARAALEYTRVVELTPRRAVAHSNLGVALERQGDLHGALIQTTEAVELDPLRPTPWVNLTRLLLRTQGADAARSALQAAQRHEVHDPRLDALARQLQWSADASGGTTRK